MDHFDADQGDHIRSSEYDFAWRSRKMLFALIHLLAGTVLAGVFVTIVVATPALFDMGRQLIPIAAAAGFLAAFPVAYVVTRRIKSQTSSR
jgi:putative flippase GtrA